MPQLEIHHADGNVTYAELQQEKPLLIGSMPNCDVVLRDPSVKRVHCRIVWRDNRWRVEVAADAGTVRIGDKHVKAGTVRTGDVIGIAGYRIYMDAGAEDARPVPDMDLGTELGLDQAEPAEYAPTAAIPATGRTSGRKVTPVKDTRGAWTKLWDSLRRKTKEQFQGEVDRPPGEERILGSPLVRWLLIGFVVFVALAWYFYADFRNKTIMAHFDKAQAEMGKENFEGAIQLFSSFNELYPTHDLASNARVQRALCEVQSAGSPVAAMEQVRKLIRERSKERAFAPIAPKIGEVVGRLAQTLAENARDRADPKALERSLEVQEILARDLSAAPLTTDARGKLDQTMDEARRAIQKNDEFVATRDKMDQAIHAGDSWPAYAARDKLLQRYPDYENNDDLRTRMEKCNKLDRDAIKFTSQSKPALTERRASPIAATTLLLDRTGPDAAPAGDVVFVIVGGVCHAHDVASGKLVWHMEMGVDAAGLPVPVPSASEPTVLVTNTRHNELVAVRSKTGQVAWRQPLGEALEAAPLVLRNRIYQPTAQGHLFLLDANTGAVVGSLNFGAQRFATTPASDDAGQHLYLLGDQYNVYVVTVANPPKVEFVYFLDHQPDTVFAPPLRMGRYLAIFENNSPTQHVLRVLLLSPDGKALEERQRKAPVNGWVHYAPTVWGNQMFVATDTESVVAYSLGSVEKDEGFKPITTAVPATPANPRGPAHPLKYTERDLVVSAGKVRHYEFKAEQQTLTPTELPLEGVGSQPIQRHPANGPVQTLFLTRRVPSSPAVFFDALNAATPKLDSRWNVLLGDSVLLLTAAAESANEWVAVTHAGRLYRVPATTLMSGGVLDKPAAQVAPGVVLSTDTAPAVLPNRAAVFAQVDDPKALLVRPMAANAQTVRITLPDALQSNVVPFKDGILAGTKDGRIYWLSPADGKQLAEPFQPALQLAEPHQWRGLAVSDKGHILATDQAGNVYQVEWKSGPPAHLAARAETTKLPKPVRPGLATVANVLACVDEENTLRMLDADNLGSVAEIKLPSVPALGPLAIGGHIFVVAGHDELVCVNGQGQLAWRLPLGGDDLAGPPAVKGDTAILATRGGVVRAVKLADRTEVWNLATEKSLASGPVVVGDVCVVAGDDGSLNAVKPPAR
jgi:outer membrane protein assembly factor BamB/pSer/pThr/pTyr-binding forkhead associated (FHA) protein